MNQYAKSQLGIKSAFHEHKAMAVGLAIGCGPLPAGTMSHGRLARATKQNWMGAD
jgi:hypothetical protein